MRMRKLKITSNSKLNLDIMELSGICVIVLSKGVVEVTELPKYAEIKIVTHQGIVKRV